MAKTTSKSILGGRVSYKRTIQPQPYESKTAEVEFQFTVEGSEHPAEVAAEALRMAKDEAHYALGLKGD